MPTLSGNQPIPSAPVTGLGRRSLLRTSAATLAGAGVLAVTPRPVAWSAPPRPMVRAWPGHMPGRIHLGWSDGGDLAGTLAQTGPVTLRRSFFQWREGEPEQRRILDDHAAGRLPWISFKPPSTAAGGWAAVASGTFDADIRARARRYAGLTRPVIATFHHEPNNDATGTGAEYAAAWVRIHDVMADETGLANCTSVPVLTCWSFDPANRRDNPGVYLRQGVLDRCHFVGIDLYQSPQGYGFAERLGAVLDFLEARGHPTKMVGLGETGCTESFASRSATQWWNECWRWAETHTARIGAICYWNSRVSRQHPDWAFSESPAKLAAFRASLASPVVVPARA